MNGWKKGVATAAVASSLMATVGAMAASNDMFLKLDGIKGESADSKHKGEIDVVSWSWGVAQTATAGAGGGGGAGKAQIHDISIVKKLDAASPGLFTHSTTGTHIKEVNLVVRKAGGKQVEYLKIKLEDVLISSITNAATGDQVVEHVTLNFSKVEYEYTPQKDDGSGGTPIKFGWNVKQNSKI